MPVTMPRTFTVVPLHAAFAPSVWMLRDRHDAVRPAAHGPRLAGRAVVPHFVGRGVCGPVKSATLSSVSCVPLLRAKPPVPFAVGTRRPAPSR